MTKNIKPSVASKPAPKPSPNPAKASSAANLKTTFGTPKKQK